MSDQETSDVTELGRALADVTHHAQLIIREEIELAKAEVAEKLTKLAKGAAVGAAAGVFVVAGLIYFLHGLAWLIWQLIGGESSFWIGFGVVAALLFVVAALAGYIAFRFVKGGSPPVPKMAIEEAQRVRTTVRAARSETGGTK